MYGTRTFISAFTRSRQLFLSLASSIHSKPPHPTSRRSILILSSHLCLGLPSGFFPLVSPPKSCTRLSSHPYALHAPPISFSFINRTIFGEQCRSLSSSLCCFLHSRYLAPLRPKYSPQHSALLVEALHYKPEGRGFDSRSCHWNFSLI